MDQTEAHCFVESFSGAIASSRAELLQGSISIEGKAKSSSADESLDSSNCAILDAVRFRFGPDLVNHERTPALDRTGSLDLSPTHDIALLEEPERLTATLRSGEEAVS